MGVIHPTNELLGSDIIPRWAVIGWLLTTCTNQVASSNAKLALFYDWLFFDPGKDSIMNIEPAILVMHHSMKPHPAITATLLDFLCRIVKDFHPRESEKVRSGIYASLNTILEKRVLPSLSPLFENPRLDKELRVMLRERFGMFVTKDELPPPILEREDDPGDGPNAHFSDEEEEESKASLSESKRKAAAARRRSSANDESSEANPNAEENDVDDSLKELLKTVKSEKDVEKKCELVDSVMQAVIAEQIDYDQCHPLAALVADALQEEFEGEIFPSAAMAAPNSAQAIEDSIGRPIFVIFRSLCEVGDPGLILELLANLYAKQPRIGYYLLYFLNADKSGSTKRTPKERASIYKDLCEAIDPKYSLDICLVNDMRQCMEDHVDLFVHLIPEIFTNFPKHSVGNVDLMYLVVSCVDGRQVQTLVCHIVAKDFVMCKKDSFPTVLQASLSWETFEQYVLWQLSTAHELPVDCIVSVIPKMVFPQHSEALANVLLMLKDERPSIDMLKGLLSREFEPGNRFVPSALTYWLTEYDDKLADLVGAHLSKACTMSSSNKRKRGARDNAGGGLGAGGAAGKSLGHPAELCLMHLDQFRQVCRNERDLFSQRSVQTALQQAKNACTETQKKKFMDLFAVADSDSETEESHSNKSKNKKKNASNSGSASKSPAKSRKATAQPTATIKVSDSSEESSEGSEEEKPARGGGSKRGNSNNRGSSGGKSNPRKRANKVSYKISSEESSDENEVLFKKTAKKKKRVSNSDSD